MKYFRLKILGLVWLGTLGAVLFCPDNLYARRVQGALLTREEIIAVLEKITAALEEDNVELAQVLIHALRPLKYEEYWQVALGNLGQDSGKAWVYKAIAVTYFTLQEHNKVVEFDIKAAEEFLKLGMEKEAADSFKYAAINYSKWLKDYEKAAEYNAKAGECYEKAGLFKEAGDAYLVAARISGAQLKDYEKAVEYDAKAGECYEKAGLFKEAGDAYLVAARMSISPLQDWAWANKYYEKAGRLFEEAGMFDKAAECYAALNEKWD